MFEHQTGKKAEFTRAQADSVCVFQIVSRDLRGSEKQAIAEKASQTCGILLKEEAEELI